MNHPDVSADGTLLTIPRQISATHYSLYVLLDAGSLERIKTYDPAEILVSHIVRLCGPHWETLKLADVVLCYATPSERRIVDALVRNGEVLRALRLVTRGYARKSTDGGTPELLV